MAVSTLDVVGGLSLHLAQLGRPPYLKGGLLPSSQSVPTAPPASLPEAGYLLRFTPEPTKAEQKTVEQTEPCLTPCH